MGIQILNKDVSVVSSVLGKPKSNISSILGKTGWSGGGSDVIPNPVNWTDITGSGTGQTNTQTISGINTNITLRIEADYNGNGSFNIFVNDVEYDMTFQLGDDGFYSQIVSNGNTIYFNRSSSGFVSEYVTVKNTSDSNVVLDTFTISLTPGDCYLTTATVQYKGLLDDGPELTAMRTLREHYRGDVYYDNLIVEYYQNAGAIIQGIDNSVDPSVDYEFIYQSVLKVQNYVEQSMWEEAKEEYITTYFVLKNKYI